MLIKLLFPTFDLPTKRNSTSVLDYVCEGYEVNAYRYMLKPIEYNIFKNNMGKCIENIIKKKNDFLTINDKSKLIKKSIVSYT